MLRNAFLLLSVLALACATAYAKESKYERKSKKAKPAVLELKPKKDEKVDVTDLENRYWAPKDTEFSVVQNRLYTKAKRYSLQAAYGPVLNDSYNNASQFGLVANYYMSERTGVEVQFYKTFAYDSDMTQAFKNRNGITPNYNVPQWYVGAGYDWVPIYAKMSLLEKKILYFDMFVTPGIGITNLVASRYSGAFSTGVTTSTSNPQNAFTLALDVGQQIFLNEHFALRLDLRNHLFQEQIYEANTAAGDQVQRSKITYQGSAVLGVTYFFH